jgi:hypothetical protein
VECAVLERHREGVAEGFRVEVVGVLADEHVERAEGGLDPVEVAGVGGGRHELDVVGVSEGPNLRCPVAGEAILDPVDADPLGVGEPDHLDEGERGAAVAARPGPDPQIVGVHVERAHQVADPLPAAVVARWRSGRPRRAQPRPWWGCRLSGPFSSKLMTTPFAGLSR